MTYRTCFLTTCVKNHRRCEPVFKYSFKFNHMEVLLWIPYCQLLFSMQAWTALFRINTICLSTRVLAARLQRTISRSCRCKSFMARQLTRHTTVQLRWASNHPAINPCPMACDGYRLSIFLGVPCKPAVAGLVPITAGSQDTQRNVWIMMLPVTLKISCTSWGD